MVSQRPALTRLRTRQRQIFTQLPRLQHRRVTILSRAWAKVTVQTCWHLKITSRQSTVALLIKRQWTPATYLKQVKFLLSQLHHITTLRVMSPRFCRKRSSRRSRRPLISALRFIARQWCLSWAQWQQQQQLRLQQVAREFPRSSRLCLERRLLQLHQWLPLQRIFQQFLQLPLPYHTRTTQLLTFRLHMD